jgi:membrane protease YdiL (CAAX protease family)
LGSRRPASAGPGRGPVVPGRGLLNQDADSEAATTPPRWGLGDVWIGLAVAYGAAAIGGVLILIVAGLFDAQRTTAEIAQDLPLSIVALTQIPLWAGYLGVPWHAARTKGNGLRRDFHLSMRWIDVPVGLAAGLVTQLVLVPLLYAPALWLTDIDADELSKEAQELTDKATDPVGVLLLVLIVVVLAPLIEEIFFRGLFQRAALRRYGSVLAIVLPAVVFGAVHLQPLQFPALVLFGLVAGLLVARSDRLGPAVWAHVGFNAIAVVSLLAG